VKQRLNFLSQCISADYWSCHDFYSVLLQGICNIDKNFWDICVVELGRIHDATHLCQSIFHENLVQKEI
jgi:hypothetical protein